MSFYALTGCPNVWNRLVDIFSTEADAERWLTSPHERLGGVSPFDVVCSGGEDEVLALLDQFVISQYDAETYACVVNP